MLSEFIRRLREKRKLTQEYLASEVRISRPTYVQIEQGKRELNLSEAKKLAEVFGIPFESFLREEEPHVTVRVEKAKNQSRKRREDVRISVPQERVDKFKQVLLYILKEVGGKPNIGMTALYKLLYFIDFDYYEKHEEQLMGLVYLKNQHGPTPLLFDKLIDELVKKGDVEPVKSKFYQYPQTKYLVNPRTVPDLSILDGREKEHIDWELRRLSDLTATALSDLSHKDVPWISAQSGKRLDYESVFYRTADTSVRDYGTSDED
ncbi:MAG: helix-turn-helix domain-containing protein [Terriglobia bacterium]